MKIKYVGHPLLGAALPVVLAMFSTRSYAQISNFSLTTSSYSQNFDGMSITGSAPLPQGWGLGSGNPTNPSTATTTVVLSAGTTGSGVFNGSSTGNSYVMVNGAQTSGTDKSIGFLNSSGYTSPRSIIFGFTNNTGNTISAISLDWNYEKYRSGLRAFNWTFFGSNDGATYAAVSAGNQSYAADANNTTVPNPPLQVSANGSSAVVISGISVPNASSYYLQWVLTGVGGSTNGQALAIDDFTVNVIGPQYWDNVAGVGLGGNGSWSESPSNLNWNQNSDGSGTPAQYTAGVPASFGGTAGVVSVSGTVNVTAPVSFNVNGYTVQGTSGVGTLALGTGASIGVTNAGDTATIDVKLSGAGGLAKTGAGNLVVTNTGNDYTGNTTVSAGTLSVSSDANLGNSANNVVLGGGALRATSSIITSATRVLSGNGFIDAAGVATNLQWTGNTAVGSISLSGSGVVELAGATNTANNIVLTNNGTLKLTGGDLLMSGADTVSSTTTSGVATVTGPAAVDFGTGSAAISVATGGTLQADHLKSTNTVTGITKLGGGTLALTGDQPGVGIFRLGLAGASADGGYIAISTDGALGTGNFLFNNGTLAASAPVTLANNVSIGGGQLGNGAVIDGDVTINGGVSLFKPSGTTLTHKVMVTTGHVVTFNGSIGTSTGSGTSNGLTLLGSGELIINNASNAVAETITVNGPTLTLNGSLTAANVNLSSGTIRGHGSMQLLTATGGTVSPGTPSSPAALTTNGFNFNGATTLTIKLAGHTTPGVDYDQIVVSETATTVNVGGATLNLLHLGGYLPDQNHRQYTLVENRSSQPVTGEFANLANGNSVQVDGQWYQIHYNVGVGANDVVIESVPEPTGMALLSMFSAACAMRRVRRTTRGRLI